MKTGEVAREALRIREHRARYKRLKHELKKGLDQVERGAVVPYNMAAAKKAAAKKAAAKKAAAKKAAAKRAAAKRAARSAFKSGRKAKPFVAPRD